MQRVLASFVVCLMPSLGLAADKPTVDLFDSVEDEKLKSEAPESGVIASQKAWEKLAKAWSIVKAPKVDFTKELLVVGTWRGSEFKLTPSVDSEGNLTIAAAGTKDLRPGFRYRIVSVDRSIIKTVKGKPVPKE